MKGVRNGCVQTLFTSAAGAWYRCTADVINFTVVRGVVVFNNVCISRYLQWVSMCLLSPTMHGLAGAVQASGALAYEAEEGFEES